MGGRLGQHFLTDPRILDRIVEALEPGPHDVAIEIGPGRGALTRRLAPRVARIIAIEKDARLAAGLADQWPVGRGARGAAGAGYVHVVHGDALEVPWDALLASGASPHSPLAVHDCKVVGNIPYYITTPLIEKALELASCRLVVFLVQREVAERLAAGPGSKTYGALSAGVQAVARVERLFVVRAGAFNPPPKVASALVRLTPLEVPLVSGPEHPAFRGFLAGVFSQRRKQLGRSLRSLTGASKEDVAHLIEGADLPAAARPEELAPADLVRLFRALGKGATTGK